MSEFHHISVLLSETVNRVLPSEKLIEELEKNNTHVNIVDATLGGAGHACEFIKQFFSLPLYKNLKLNFIGIDQDEVAVKFATKKLNDLKKEYHQFNFYIFQKNFDELDDILKSSDLKQIKHLHGFYADLGVSSPQIDSHERGFSFLKEGPLDMRMNTKHSLTAAKILLSYPEAELARIFFEYGEEPKSRLLAKRIVNDRKEGKLPVDTTKDFAEYVKKTLKYGYSRHHPATRVFQALRIEINRELESIQTLLSFLPKVMHPHSHAGFITFHSLEDRLVKRSMRTWQEQGLGKESPRGGITPTQVNIMENPRARSARLRVFDFSR